MNINIFRCFLGKQETKIIKGFLFGFWCLVFVLGLVSMEPVVYAANDGNLELVGEVSPSCGVTIQWIEAIQVLDSNPNEIVFVSQNKGAGCGGGTPVAAWKMYLDPNTGEMISVECKQRLSLIQNIRMALFEDSNGILFTGSGWCGYKPPYYSIDGGESWARADAGPVHPPNSTFSFTEFKGSVYAGTGYEPWHGQVYRWLGSGNWQLVLDISPPRSIVTSIVLYENQLFVGSMVYWYSPSGCQYSTPVYVSTDGSTFHSTTGIPNCISIEKLLTVGDQLIAGVINYPFGNKRHIYHWNNGAGVWEEIGPIYFTRMSGGQMVASNGAIYIYGKAPGDASAGLYRSTDLGQNWSQVAILEYPDVKTMHVHDNMIYLGTYSDSKNKAYIYRFSDVIKATIDIDPDKLNLKSNGKWVTGYIELPGDYLIDDIDIETVAIAKINENSIDLLYREGPADIGDYDWDDIQDLMVKFDRQELTTLLKNMNARDGDEIALTVSGKLNGGESFEGSCTITVINKGKK
jgi:hypothetical protein